MVEGEIIFLRNELEARTKRELLLRQENEELQILLHRSSLESSSRGLSPNSLEAHGARSDEVSAQLPVFESPFSLRALRPRVSQAAFHAQFSGPGGGLGRSFAASPSFTRSSCSLAARLQKTLEPGRPWTAPHGNPPARRAPCSSRERSWAGSPEQSLLQPQIASGQATRKASFLSYPTERADNLGLARASSTPALNRAARGWHCADTTPTSIGPSLTPSSHDVTPRWRRPTGQQRPGPWSSPSSVQQSMRASPSASLEEPSTMAGPSFSASEGRYSLYRICQNLPRDLRELPARQQAL